MGEKYQTSRRSFLKSVSLTVTGLVLIVQKDNFSEQKTPNNTYPCKLFDAYKKLVSQHLNQLPEFSLR